MLPYIAYMDPMSYECYTIYIVGIRWIVHVLQTWTSRPHRNQSESVSSGTQIQHNRLHAKQPTASHWMNMRGIASDKQPLNQAIGLFGSIQRLPTNKRGNGSHVE